MSCLESKLTPLADNRPLIWFLHKSLVHTAGLAEVRQLGSLAAAAAGAADTAGRPAAALQLHAASVVCLGIKLDVAEPAGTRFRLVNAHHLTMCAMVLSFQESRPLSCGPIDCD